MGWTWRTKSATRTARRARSECKRHADRAHGGLVTGNFNGAMPIAANELAGANARP
jgi:hypothetical protein